MEQILELESQLNKYEADTKTLQIQNDSLKREKNDKSDAVSKQKVKLIETSSYFNLYRMNIS